MNLFTQRLLPILAVLSVFTAYSPAASAGFKIGAEPYAGYGLLGTLGASGQTADTYSGLLLGARATFNFLDMFFVGPDFSYKPYISYTNGDGSSTSGTTFTNLRLGVIAGVQLPFPLRVWIGYNFLNQLIGSTSSISGTYSGYSFKAGVGYRFLPYLSVNAEFLMHYYTSLSASVAGTSITTNLTGNSVKSGNVLLLSVSAPFSFPI